MLLDCGDVEPHPSPKLAGKVPGGACRRGAGARARFLRLTAAALLMVLALALALALTLTLTLPLLVGCSVCRATGWADMRC